MKWKFAMSVVAFFFLGFCSSQCAYAAPPKDACSLLTPAQVSAALGVPAAGKALGLNVCIWIETGVKPGSPKRKVDLLILNMPGYTGGYEAAKMPNASTAATHVSGLGDDAYYLSMTSGKNMEIRVKKGSVAFAIQMQSSGTSFTPDEIKAKEKTLAQDALAKL